MADPITIAAVVGTSALGGVFQGALRNNADRRAAQRNLDNAVVQLELYEMRIGQLSAVASIEAGGMFARAAEVKGERMASLAARGISLDSGVVEQVNFREREVLLQAVNTVVSNAWMEASTFRLQGRLQVQASRQALQEVRARRTQDMLLGGVTSAFDSATNIMTARATASAAAPATGS